MNKAELIEALADKAGVQKQSAKQLLDAYIDIVTEKCLKKKKLQSLVSGH